MEGVDEAIGCTKESGVVSTEHLLPDTKPTDNARTTMATVPSLSEDSRSGETSFFMISPHQELISIHDCYPLINHSNNRYVQLFMHLILNFVWSLFLQLIMEFLVCKHVWVAHNVIELLLKAIIHCAKDYMKQTLQNFLWGVHGISSTLANSTDQRLAT